ncbi:MAG: hypothetical protein IH789_00780 [Acidobacteria bacterium]|nr:hypothetical protein [Acidobacteriota bacterium]MCH8946148.1 hypothetical protein [Acidobacteriota bacterium]
MHKHKGASVPQPYTIGRLRHGSAKPWGILLAGATVSGLGASPHWLPTLFSRRRQPSTA